MNHFTHSAAQGEVFWNLQAGRGGLRAGWGCLRAGQSRGCKDCRQVLGENGDFCLLDIMMGLSNCLLGYLRFSTANWQFEGRVTKVFLSWGTSSGWCFGGG